MSKNQNKNKYFVYVYVLLTIAGCVLACSSLIPNDYVKLVIVMGTLFVGIYGLMKAMSPSITEESDSKVCGERMDK
ncbi:MAG: hypothetical protein ACI30I_01560 [Parabacteroides sp.]